MGERIRCRKCGDILQVNIDMIFKCVNVDLVI